MKSHATTEDVSGNVSPSPSLVRQCLAELLGTFMLVLLGCGSVHASVLLGAQAGVWQVAIVLGVAVMLAIYLFGGISGAHINPAITVALATFGRCEKWKIGPYVGSQFSGAFLAAVVLFAIFEPYHAAREAEKQVERGAPGSIVTAMCFCEYFPSPGGMSTAAGPYVESERTAQRGLFRESRAILAEVVATMLLALVVFGVTDDRNAGAPPQRMAAPFIGLTVAALISVMGPLTQACFNPARDFGPRAFIYLAGWKSAAIPGETPHGWWTVYIAAPIAGALLGAAIYEALVRPAHPRHAS